jgi:hypothetical protein
VGVGGEMHEVLNTVDSGTGLSINGTQYQWYQNTASNCISYPYPSYIYVDKTAKAIAIAKQLMDEHQLMVEGIDEFLSIVEKIKAQM